MKLSYSFLSRKVAAFFRENIAACIVFFFLFVAGIACGINMIQQEYQNEMLQSIRIMPAMLRVHGVAWLRICTLSICSHLFFASIILLSCIFLPACIFWPVSILLRGLVVGAGIGACIVALPSRTAWYLLVMIWIDTACLLPPMLRMCVFSGKIIRARTSFQSITHFFATEEMFAYLRMSAGLFVCVLIESIVMPMIVFSFA